MATLHAADHDNIVNSIKEINNNAHQKYDNFDQKKR